MRITKYFLSMAAAVGMIAGCQKPEMVQMLPIEDVVAPVLSDVAAIEITADNLGLESASFSWTAADYGVKTQINYAIEVSSANHTDKVVVTSGLTETKATVSYESLNAILLYDLGLASGVAEDVQFVVSAKVGESPKVYSNAVTVSASATEAEKVYPSLTVAGSYPYNNWTPGKGQFVFDFDGTDEKYSGIIDFGEDVSSLNFKFVGSAWGENEFSVPSGEAQAAEAAELPLVAGGGDNISAYTTHRYYSLTLDKKTPKVIKNFSFNTLGVIGDATPTGWDSDTDMAFNAAKQRFYVDITLVDGTIKFRANDAWDVNWGGADGVLASGADNIPVTAGNYRIYVNLNNPAEPVYELSAKMYGQPEDTGATEPKPDDPVEPSAKGWALIGDFNSWGGDLAMTQSGVIWSAKDVELKAGEGWKLRKDGGWDVNVGATGDVEPFEVPVGEKFAVAAGGKNLTVPADGNYDVYFDEGNNVICVVEAGADAPKFDLTWFLVGGFNGWTVGDMAYKMTKGTEYYEFKGFTLEADNEVKFNAGSWDINRGGSFSANAALEAKDGGDNFKVPAGKYDVYMDLKAEKIYFMSEGKTPADAGEAVVTYVDASKVAVGLSGSFNEWGDPAGAFLAEFASKEVTDEATYAGTYSFELSGVEIANGNEFKVRINSGWFGTAETTVEGLTVTDNGGNIAAGEGGTFNVVITFAWDGLKPSEIKAVFSK